MGNIKETYEILTQLADEFFIHKGLLNRINNHKHISKTALLRYIFILKQGIYERCNS